MILEKYVKACFRKYMDEEGFSKNEISDFLSLCELEIDDIVDELNAYIMDKVEFLIEEKFSFSTDDE